MSDNSYETNIKKHKKLTLFYASGAGFSGQRFATEILIKGLQENEWQLTTILTPALDRSNSEKLSFYWQNLQILIDLFLLFLKSLTVIFDTQQLIYVNLAQTKYGIVRDGFSLLIRSLISDREKAVVSLHGSLFLEWQNNSLEVKLLQKIVRAANYITILGFNHQQKLLSFNIPANKIVQIDNTCLLKPLSQIEVLKKQQPNPQQPVTVLFLSSLMETKGYLEFIEAIAQLAQTTTNPINAVVCGKIIINKNDSQKFCNVAEAKNWIEDQIAQINQSSSVRLQWIEGVFGKEKETLFHQAQIFVLPSRYRVEAQPIALLEALASGCAIVTTKVGEISNTVSQETAQLLDVPSSLAIAQNIQELIEHSKKRELLAINGLKLFESRFSYPKHINQWENLLEKLL